MVEPPSDGGPIDSLLCIVRGVLVQLPADRTIALEDSLVDLGVTSFQLMQIIAAVEQTYDIELPDSALALTTFETIGSLAAIVDTLARQQPGSAGR